ncbi:hypothetical protein LTS08_006415 [Lithohypha guttulata]|uniref:ADF-H domain-containing protein n=1 Tax=Lithohypha guttulata TaxID=1690604 RepID=A0AAN7YFQ0_9EURO|nr:hypothetical protein LTR05_006494 [Lithohypha guttulata]KAK5098282.1 hypothetical protein LTS08_006415 [Lithohypha guttulata]
MYTFSQETREALLKFRLGTSRAKTPQAKIYSIDIKTQEIKAAEEEIYTDMQELADALPETSPRFVLLSYPMTMSRYVQPSGGFSVPYVLLYYRPENCNPKQYMSYAGAVEEVREAAGVNRVIELDNAEDLETIETRLARKE